MFKKLKERMKKIKKESAYEKEMFQKGYIKRTVTKTWSSSAGESGKTEDVYWELLKYMVM